MIYSNKQKRISNELDDVYWFQEGPGVRNWQFTHSGIKLLNVANISKNGTIELEKTDRYLSEEEVKSKYQHFLVDEGDLVIASSGISIDDDGLLRTRGAFIYREHLPLCMNTSTIRFKGKEGISDLHFLKFWLDSYEFRDQITKLVTGSAQQNFGPSHLKSIKITLPSPSEQKRIATILEKADHLRRLRRYALELSGTYLQSVFLEMFGDPDKNPKNWSKDYLYQLCSKVVDCPHSTPIYTSTPTAYSCVRSSDIQDGFLDWSTTKYIDYQEYQKRIRIHVPMPNEVVYCREGARFGNAAIIPNGKKVCLGQRMMLFRAALDVATPEFIWAFLESESTRKQADGIVAGSASPHLNVGDIKEFITIIPPLLLQQKFAQIVRKYERLRAQQREAERQAEHLFQTLLHKAFQGELSLGEDEVLMADVEIAQQRMPVFADVIEPINTVDAFQLALPME